MKNSKLDWKDILATFVAVLAATIIKHFVFTEHWLEYSLWKDLLSYMVLFLPIYLLMLLILGKFRKQ